MTQRICVRRHLCKAAVHVAAWLGISYAHAAELPAESIAGTYEILICKDSCPAAGDKDVLLKGHVVLFPKSLQQSELTRFDFPGMSRMLRPPPNGCFSR